jgi:hypothetical protein
MRTVQRQAIRGVTGGKPDISTCAERRTFLFALDTFGPADVAYVPVSVVMETRDAAHIAEIREVLKGKGFELP